MNRGGATKMPEFVIWKGMIARCYDRDSKGWEAYGGMGVRVCRRWRNDPWAFFADVGRRPPGTTLDRIDPNGDYEPSNVRWASARDQATNRRRPKAPTAPLALAAMVRLMGLDFGEGPNDDRADGRLVERFLNPKTSKKGQKIARAITRIRAVRAELARRKALCP